MLRAGDAGAGSMGTVLSSTGLIFLFRRSLPWLSLHAIRVWQSGLPRIVDGVRYENGRGTEEVVAIGEFFSAKKPLELGIVPS